MLACEQQLTQTRANVTKPRTRHDATRMSFTSGCVLRSFPGFKPAHVSMLASNPPSCVRTFKKQSWNSRWVTNYWPTLKVSLSDMLVRRWLGPGGAAAAWAADGDREGGTGEWRLGFYTREPKFNRRTQQPTLRSCWLRRIPAPRTSDLIGRGSRPNQMTGLRFGASWEMTDVESDVCGSE